MDRSRNSRPTRRGTWARPFSGALLLGALLLGVVGVVGAVGAQTATAADGDRCPASLAGTQAYAECIARGGYQVWTPQSPDGESARQGPLAAPAWELALSGLVGAAVAGGVVVAARRWGSPTAAGQ